MKTGIVPFGEGEPLKIGDDFIHNDVKKGTVKAVDPINKEYLLEFEPNAHLREMSLGEILDAKGISDEDLKAELNKREQQTKKQEIPVPLESPNYESVRSFAESLVKEKAAGNARDEDDAQYSFECLLTTVYGNGIWDWWNKQ